MTSTSASISSLSPTSTAVTTSPLPSPTETNSSGNSATSSPLLFFVALGFGVLFTNLWIIVGVKYCFRYSQRNRRGHPPDEEVDLATLHPFVGLTHPVQRRRREKKLLKIDEVNERFPVMTYKAWRAQREREGLSAEGGIATTTPATRPVPDPSAEHDPSPSSPPPEPDSDLSPAKSPIETSPELFVDALTPSELSEKDPLSPPVTNEQSTPELLEAPSSPVASSSKQRDSTLSVDPDAEDDDNPHSIPNELLTTTGDNCAICIELLEDNDEVRGLTCGHCYHQSCLDPWLTHRKASCPLCKTDYYIPKPTLPDPACPEPSSPLPHRPSAERSTTTTTTIQPVTTEHWAPLFFRPFSRPMGTSSSRRASHPDSSLTRYPAEETGRPPRTWWRIRRTEPRPPRENTHDTDSRRARVWNRILWRSRPTTTAESNPPENTPERESSAPQEV